MMDIVKAVTQQYPDMVSGVGFIVGTDAYGNQVITYWDTSKHPLPTSDELQAWWLNYLRATQNAVIAASSLQVLSSGFTSQTVGKTFPLGALGVAMLAGEYSYLQANSGATPKNLRALDGSVWSPTRDEYFAFSDELRTFLATLEDKQWAKDALIETVAETVIPTVLWDAPTVPQGLSGTAGTGTVTLTWTANPDSDLASYTVYQDGVSTVTGVTTTSTTVSGLTSGTEYTFTVAAVDTSGGESAQSAPVQVTPN